MFDGGFSLCVDEDDLQAVNVTCPRLFSETSILLMVRLEIGMLTRKIPARIFSSLFCLYCIDRSPIKAAAMQILESLACVVYLGMVVSYRKGPL